MYIRRMKCNHLCNPIGFNLGRPRLSWVVEGPEAKTRKAVEERLEKEFEAY